MNFLFMMTDTEMHLFKMDHAAVNSHVKSSDVITDPPSGLLGPPLWVEEYWVQTQWRGSEHSFYCHWNETVPHPET